MTSFKLHHFTLAWVYAAAVLVLMAGMHLGQEPPAKAPEATLRSEPVREAVQQLLADEWVLNQDWSTRAAQWPGTGPMPEATRQTLQNAWPELLKDVETLQKYALVVLRLDQIQKTQELLRPYLTNPDADSRALSARLDKKLQALLQLQAPAGSATVPLSWVRLEQVAADMDQIQETIRDFRRMSLDKGVPDSAKLPMRLFVQLSLTFPTAGVRDFVMVANRLVQRRWGMLYQLEKDKVAVVKLEANAGKPAPLDGVWYLALAGLLGTALLVRLHQRASQWQDLCQREVDTAQQLKDELRRVTQAAAPAAQALPVASPLLARVTEDLPDLRGRIKNVQMRFDAGQALELAAQDLTIIDEKLGEWDRQMTRAPAQTSGAVHG